MALAGVIPLGLVVRLRYALVPTDEPQPGWEVVPLAYEYLLLDGAGRSSLPFTGSRGGGLVEVDGAAESESAALDFLADVDIAALRVLAPAPARP